MAVLLHHNLAVTLMFDNYIEDREQVCLRQKKDSKTLQLCTIKTEKLTSWSENKPKYKR